MKQRIANAFSEGGPEMGWQDGDLLVHFAGCWVNNKCVERWEDFWSRKGEVPLGPVREAESIRDKYLD